MTRSGAKNNGIRRAFSLFLSLISCLTFLAFPAFAAEKDYPAQPEINGKYAIVMDFDTGKVYYEKDADKTNQIGSMTKMMTVYLVMDSIKAGNMSLDTMVPITKRAAEISADYEYSGVKTFKRGEKYPAELLIQLSLIPSCCASSIALAEFLSPDGTEAGFVGLMNAKAERWGIDAKFSDSAGLVDEGAASSPRAVAILARKLLKNHPKVLEYTSMEKVTFNGQDYMNTGALFLNESSACIGIDGVKSGFTDLAGRCYAGTSKRGKHRVISVTMMTDSVYDRNEDTSKLLNYGFECIARRENDISLLGGRYITLSLNGEKYALAKFGTAFKLSDDGTAEVSRLPKGTAPSFGIYAIRIKNALTG